jgi:hypothetical protein
VLLDWFVRHKRFGKFKKAFHTDVLPVKSLESFPRIIYLFWDQGFDHAPDLVRRCVQSWTEQNPGWTVRLLERSDADAIVPRANLPDSLKATPYSDILRSELLNRNGGVWADATLYCTRGLDCWLLSVMTQTDFFAFSRPGPDREIASWFLASRPDAYIISQLTVGVRRFWKRQEAPTRVYHWYQFVFEYLARTSVRFRREWRTAPRLSAAPMLLLQDQLARGEHSDPEQLALYRALPMHKLTHKRPIDLTKLEELLS